MLPCPAPDDRTLSKLHRTNMPVKEFVEREQKRRIASFSGYSGAQKTYIANPPTSPVSLTAGNSIRGQHDDQRRSNETAGRGD